MRKIYKETFAQRLMREIDTEGLLPEDIKGAVEETVRITEPTAEDADSVRREIGRMERRREEMYRTKAPMRWVCRLEGEIYAMQCAADAMGGRRESRG